jgi:hypothetical protein
MDMQKQFYQVYDTGFSRAIKETSGVGRPIPLL